MSVYYVIDEIAAMFLMFYDIIKSKQTTMQGVGISDNICQVTRHSICRMPSTHSSA